MHSGNYSESFGVFLKKGRRKTVQITQEPNWLWCREEGHTFSFLCILKRPLREVFGEPWPGPCAFRLLSFPVSGLCCQLSLKTIRLLSSFQEPLAQLMSKKPLLDLYNLTVKLHLSIVVIWGEWVCMVIRYIHRYTQIYLHCFFSVCQSGCGRSVNPTVFSTQMPCQLSAASLSILNSIDFNVFLYRAGKGPHRSLGYEKEEFAFLTKRNQQ